MYSLFAIFLTIPLYFSHVFSPFGLIIGDGSSFERQKVYLFLILISIACIEFLIHSYNTFSITFQKYKYVFCIALLLPIIGWYLFGNNFLDNSYLLWSYEKHHGYLFYLGCIVLVLLLLSSPIDSLKKYLYTSTIAATIVGLIAIWEQLWGWWDIYGRSMMVSSYEWRSSSTLWNPNYVAGYLLFFVPILLHQIIFYAKYRVYNTIALCIIMMWIVTTWSYIWLYIVWAIFLLYNTKYIFSEFSRQAQYVLYVILLLVITFLGFLFIDGDKMLSLYSRFILMWSTLQGIFSDYFAIFFGFWSDSILWYYSQLRSELIDQYFPRFMLIDSSHNIWIDVWFQYGAVFVWWCIYFTYRIREQLSSAIGIAFIGGIVFLSLNVMVLSHMILLILLWVTMYQNSLKKSK